MADDPLREFIRDLHSNANPFMPDRSAHAGPAVPAALAALAVAASFAALAAGILLT